MRAAKGMRRYVTQAHSHAENNATAIAFRGTGTFRVLGEVPRPEYPRLGLGASQRV